MNPNYVNSKRVRNNELKLRAEELAKQRKKDEQKKSS